MSAVDTGRALLALVALERLLELRVSRHNTRRLLARGGVEAAGGHYPAMVAFHAALLLACLAEPVLLPTSWPLEATLPAAVLVLLSQGLRWWAVASLGDRWTTRVVVVPGATPVRSGPYRFLRHPNYLAVAVEVLSLPLACGAWRTALVAGVGNALLLFVRIRAEEDALGAAFSRAFRGVPRLLPRSLSRAGKGRP